MEQVEVVGKMLELGLIDIPAARGMLDLVEEGSER
jgi:hypothetical protein